MAEPAASPADAEPIGYGDALAELEGILTEIEDDAVNVDVLAARVRRAAELLRVCRDRIVSARVEVTQIVADLEPAAGTGGAAFAEADDGEGEGTEDDVRG